MNPVFCLCESVALILENSYVFIMVPLTLLDLTRYVDMIANPEVADVFRKRAKVGYQNIQTFI